MEGFRYCYCYGYGFSNSPRRSTLHRCHRLRRPAKGPLRTTACRTPPHCSPQIPRPCRLLTRSLASIGKFNRRWVIHRRLTRAACDGSVFSSLPRRIVSPWMLRSPIAPHDVVNPMLPGTLTPAMDSKARFESVESAANLIHHNRRRPRSIHRASGDLALDDERRISEPRARSRPTVERQWSSVQSPSHGL